LLRRGLDIDAKLTRRPSRVVILRCIVW
jgi:hypothetical protein